MKSEKLKQPHTFHLSPQINMLIDTHLDPSGASSRSRFVEEAVELYCNKLDNKETRMFLDDEIVNVIRAIVKEAQGILLSNVRSIDISLSMLNLLFAANLVDMTETDIALMRRDAIRYVDENRRARSFVTAWRDQKGDD